MNEQVTVIAGIVIPSTSPVFLTIVGVHTAIALLALTTGIITMLSPKRAGRHPRMGRIYFRALCALFASASVLAFMRWSENAHLFFIGLAAFASALVARTAVRARWRRWAQWHLLGMGSSFVLMLIAFYLDNGRNLPLWRDLPPASYWAIPAGIGIAVMAWVLLHHPLTRPTPRGQR